MDAKHGCRHHAVRASSSSWVSLKEEDVVALAPDGGRLFFTLGPLRTEPGLQIALARTATATAPNVAPDDSAPIVPHNLLFALIADAIPVVLHRTRLPSPPRPGASSCNSAGPASPSENGQ